MLGDSIKKKGGDGEVDKGHGGTIEKGGICEVAFVMDRSGSMGSHTTEACDGFNNFIRSQRGAKGKAEITVSLFDTDIDVLCSGEPMANAPFMDRGNYCTGGGTALLDAIGKTMGEMMMRHSTVGKPGRTIFVILTDGQENMSKEYTVPVVKDMIGRARNVFGWEFIVIGIGIDVSEITSDLGIEERFALPVAKTAEGVGRAFDEASKSVANFREGKSAALLPEKAG
jgi:hypothetical protein